MANWLKGNFSQSAGFNRDIYAERYFAPGCTLDLSETTLARVYTGPEGASDWLEYKEDFEFGPAPFDGVGGANASEVHQKLPGGGYCTWTIRNGMVHGFVAKPSAGVGSWPAQLRARPPTRAAVVGDRRRAVPMLTGGVRGRAGNGTREKGLMCGRAHVNGNPGVCCNKNCSVLSTRYGSTQPPTTAHARKQ